jgi:GTP pyrophosphokinase
MKNTEAYNIEHWLQKLLQENVGSKDVEIIRQALEFRQAEISADKKQDQLAYTLGVANTLFDLQVDIDTLVAGILHDARIHDDERLKTIEKTFGGRISALVSGVLFSPASLYKSMAKTCARCCLQWSRMSELS